MKKVIIIGSCGAGKSTLARALHEITRIPLIHLDQAYWNAGWVEPETHEWEEKVRKLCQQESWIMDGNYGGTMKMRGQYADTIILIKSTPLKSLYRVIKRTAKYYGRTRPDMHEDCPERWSLSFFHYVLMYNLTRIPSIESWLKEIHSEKRIVILQDQTSIDDWLLAVARSKNYDEMTSMGLSGLA